jgi:hypothetical protein
MEKFVELDIREKLKYSKKTRLSATLSTTPSDFVSLILCKVHAICIYSVSTKPLRVLKNYGAQTN